MNSTHFNRLQKRKSSSVRINFLYVLPCKFLLSVPILRILFFKSKTDAWHVILEIDFTFVVTWFVIYCFFFFSMLIEVGLFSCVSFYLRSYQSPCVFPYNCQGSSGISFTRSNSPCAVRTHLTPMKWNVKSSLTYSICDDVQVYMVKSCCCREAVLSWKWKFFLTVLILHTVW